MTYLLSYIQPFDTLWFIYILPVFYVVARLKRMIAPPIMLAAVVLLQVLPVHTGAVVVDEFASYFLWFYLGYVYAPRAFKLAVWAGKHAAAAVIAITWWVVNINFPLAALTAPYAVSAGVEELPLSMMPVVSLLLGLAGSAALVALSSVLAHRHWLGAILWVRRLFDRHLPCLIPANGHHPCRALGSGPIDFG